MKKALLILVAVGFILSSCKKDKSNPGNTGQPQKKYPVNFTVGDFRQITENQAGITTNSLKSPKTNGLSDYVNTLYYYVFDSSKKLQHLLKQQSTSPNFGNITDSLAAGNYTVLFLAGPSPVQYSSTDAITFLNLNANWGDTFFKKMTLTVGNAPITQAISLPRVVSRIDVNLEDAIPANAKTIKITFTYETRSYSVALDAPITSDPYLLTVTKDIPASAIGTTNYKIATIVANTVTPIVVNITCYDASNNIIGQTTVNGINCHKNQVTVLSGKLFQVNNGFGISLGNTWGDPINIKY